MRDYGKIYSTFWSSETTADLSDDSKLLAVYLMTCSHSTIAGAFRLPDGYVSEDLGWVIGRVAEGFDQLFAKGFAYRCETTKWVWVCKHLEWNKLDNPNQRKSAAKIALSIPDQCAWKQAYMRDCAEILGIDYTPEENPSETLPKPLANQYLELKQKQELEKREPALAPQSPPAQPSKPEKPKREQVTLLAYLDGCKASKSKPIPDGHSIRTWATDAGLAPEMLQIAWLQFRERYTEGEKAKGKRYKDWPAHFATAVKANWFKLWFLDDAGHPAWTTVGLTHKAVLDAKAKRETANV